MFNTTDTSAFPAPHTVLAGLAFGVPSTHLRELDAALTRLETIERASRKLEAARIPELARIDRATRLEAAAGSPSVKTGKSAAEDSMAYRAARADTATALHLTEQTAASHLARAATLTSAYPTMGTVLEAGEIDMRHITVMLEAGHMIGPVVLPGDSGPGLLDTESQAIVDANRAAYEARVLVEAVKTTPNRLAPVARRIAEAYALEDLETRHERARVQRAVWLIMKHDGMAEITALLPVHEAKAVESRLTQMAKRAAEADARRDREEREAREVRELREVGEVRELGEAAAKSTAEPADGAGPGAVAMPVTEHDPVAPRRTRNEIKADLFVDLLLNGTGENATGGPGSGTGITAIVQVITHEEHLTDELRRADEERLAEETAAPLNNTSGTPDTDYTSTSTSTSTAASTGGQRSGAATLTLPEIEGCGPIPGSMARDLATEDTSWSNVKVNLKTGDVLTVDTYRPSERIRRFLAARDQRCRFPGCRVPVHRCDYDHTIDAAIGGPTSTTNLGALCRGHHLLKHHSGWAAEQRENGDYEWTSPTGRTHTDEPASRVRFVPIDDLPTYGTAPPITREPESGDSEAKGTNSLMHGEPLNPHPF